MAWSGAAQGLYRYTHDNNFFLSGMTLTSGADTISTLLSWDTDGLLRGYGPFSLTRDGPAGATSGLGDGTLSRILSYDTLARLTAYTDTVNGQQSYQVQLSYDNVDHVAQKAETVLGVTHTYTYTYDADGQLRAVQRDGVAFERYAYDPNGNRTSAQVGGAPPITATYDMQDRLLQQGATAYGVDADGFLAQRGSDTFHYSALGELLTASVGGQTVTYTYDGVGRRVARTQGSATTQYLYGNPLNLYQVTAVRDPSGQLSAFSYDQMGRLVALQRGGARYYVSADQVGTPRVVTDASGTAIKTLEYDSFGMLIQDSNPAFDLPFGFAGGVGDTVTGLVHIGFRDYDPATGRWTAADPRLLASGARNLYQYAYNDPVRFIDPTGLQPLLNAATTVDLQPSGPIGGQTSLDPNNFQAALQSDGPVLPGPDLQQSLGPINASLLTDPQAGLQLSLDPTHDLQLQVQVDLLKLKLDDLELDVVGGVGVSVCSGRVQPQLQVQLQYSLGDDAPFFQLTFDPTLLDGARGAPYPVVLGTGFKF